jgi:hypothetical protein
MVLRKLSKLDLNLLHVFEAVRERFDSFTSERIMCFSMSDFAEAVLLAPLIGAINRIGSRITVRNHFVSERHPASESSPAHKWVRRLLEDCFPPVCEVSRSSPDHLQ